MRIVYCIKGTYNSGGMERVLANKVNYLADRAGFEVYVITTEQRGRKPFYVFSDKVNFHDLDIRYWDLPGLPLIRRKMQLYSKRALHKKRLSAKLNYLKPDITVSMFDEDAILLPGMKDGSVKILEAHFSKNVETDFVRYHGGGILKKLNASLSNQRNHALSQRYTRFITLTDEDRLLRGGTDNMAVIPNAVTLIPAKRADPAKKRVIAAGRMDPQKGFDLLIETWVTVAQDFPDWELAIYGAGPDEQKLKDLIERLHLTGTVHISPPTGDITTEYLNSSVYALSSRYEGLPMVMLEAMACGLPVVAFKCQCGPKDVITDGVNGFLVEQEDKKAMAEKIKILIANQDLRQQMGDHARRKVEDYLCDRIMMRWIELFNELVGKR